MDVFQKCNEWTDAEDARKAGIYPYFRALSSAQQPVVKIGDRDVVMLGSNNYLGLTNDPEVKQATVEAAMKYGSGCAGSRFLNGNLDLHLRLEERLAEFLGYGSAVVFATGFQANLGALSSLLDRRDVAFLDQLDHACIIDGVRLSFGKMRKFRHGDLLDLEGKLEQTPPDGGKLIVVDGVFSMEGDLADLPGLVELKERYDARLMVDDAHGIGVLGAHGRGTAEHYGLEGSVDLVMGTFSKALATVGGFIASDAPVVEYIRHNARSLIFSAALPAPNVAAALKALEILEREPERCHRVCEIGQYMKRELTLLGFNTLDSVTPIVPIEVGDDLAAFRLTSLLFDQGVFVNPVISPAVPPGRAMLRTSYMATHSQDQLDFALEALAKAGREVGLIS